MKDKEEYLSCGEFLKLCGITKNTVVWYEKKGLLTPKVIGGNGYHYYALEQFFDVDLIKALKWADNSLAECKEYIEHHTEESFASMMLKQQLILEKKLSVLSHQKKIIDKTIQDYLFTKAHFCETISVISLPECYLLSKVLETRTQKEYIYALHSLFELFHQCAATYGISSSMFNGKIMSQVDLQSNNYTKYSFICLKISAEIPHSSCLKIPAGKFVVGFHKGNRANISETYVRMIDYINQEHFEISGDALEHDFINYLVTHDPDKYITEILIPVH